MKKLIASTLIATAALTTGAVAMTPKVDSEARYILPGADFSGLSAAQVAQINSAVHGSDNHNEKRALILSILK